MADTSKMTDWHCHILPGLDDGPQTADESVAMARVLAAHGFTRVCCTPHNIRGMYENPPRRVREAAASFQKVLRQAGIPITLVPSCEYYLDEFLPDFLGDPLFLHDNLVLVEIPSRAESAFVLDAIYGVVRKGLRPVIAHPERTPVLRPRREKRGGGLAGFWRSLTSRAEPAEAEGRNLLEELRLRDCLFQGNIGSLSGYYGAGVASCAESFLASSLYSIFGTDAHSARQLEEWLEPGLGKSNNGPLSPWHHDEAIERNALLS